MTSNESLSRAAYPVPPRLAQILEESAFASAVASSNSCWTDDEQKARIVHRSLTFILENAIHALDQWYFSTPSQLRSALVGHRTCLRLSTACVVRRNQNDDNNTQSKQDLKYQRSITITDLGVGMTRADLINILGVGRPISPSYKKWDDPSASPGGYSSDAASGTAVGGGTAASVTPGVNNNSNDDSSSIWKRKGLLQQQQQQGTGTALRSFSSRFMISSSSTIEGEEDVMEEEPDADSTRMVPLNARLLPHQDYLPPMDVLGGFYAAVCALAVGVRVGTKSKHDDYYEFQLGNVPVSSILSPSSNDAGNTSSWKEFVITRPLGEGCIPSLKSGQTHLTDVRGESGTSVTLYWQSPFCDWATDENLLPIITKILETTQYTFVLEGMLSKEEQEALIMADDEGQELLMRQPHEDSNGIGMGVLASPGRISSIISTASSVNSQENPNNNNNNTNEETYFSVKERAKYIPVRLSLTERKLLRLVEAAMNCCDYTTRVDKHFSSSTRRLQQQIKGVLSILRGLVTACDYKAGQTLAKDDIPTADLWAPHLDFLRKILEITRRHKIMNPEKMRMEYGKLIYFLQDIVQLQQQGHLDFLFPELPVSSTDGLSSSPSSLIAPIQTVYTFLQDRHGLAVLDDKYIEMATQEILATPGKSRKQIEAQIRRKEKAVLIITQSYASQRLSVDEIHMCLYSICDNNSFLNSNRVPIDKAIEFLEEHFHPDRPEGRFSLTIVNGTHGARLNHSHERQYYFALQSLTLWRHIVHDMFRLWAMAEEDLLSSSVSYNLQDTGQGMQRIQQSPRTYQAMQEILKRVQCTVQQWVGSSVIHLGDHNVPNALSFIDKYTQVPRILGPIVKCLENLEKVCEEDYGVQDMIDEGFGGLFLVKKEILHDFFRSAFDGSGADNNYDAGSCVDGRLTSSWNWCCQLPHKPYYPLFRLTGFTGFDGEFA